MKLSRRGTFASALAGCLLALMLVAMPGHAASAQSTCPDTYTIRSGDILVEIAGRCDTSLQALLFANPWLKDPDIIFPGQELAIPHGPAVPPAAEFTYIAQRGDTVKNVSLLFGVPEDALVNLNSDLEQDQKIQVGEELRIPAVTPVPIIGKDQYRIEPGDTLFSLANRFGTTVPEVLALNPDITNPNLIHSGALLTLPPGRVVPTGGAVTYFVKPGDTMFKIAAEFDTTIASILKYNPDIENPRVIFPGQRLVFPAKDIVIPNTGETSYAITRGVGLSKVASAFDTTVEAILQANPQIRGRDALLPGMIIGIP
jgi:LysM repeat protein